MQDVEQKGTALSPTKRLLFLFCECWKKRFKSDYPIVWSRNMPQIARARKQLGDEAVERLMRFYLGGSYSDKFAQKTGFSLGAFVYLLPSLIAAEKDSTEKVERAKAGSGEYAALEAARKRLSEGGA